MRCSNFRLCVLGRIVKRMGPELTFLLVVCYSTVVYGQLSCDPVGSAGVSCISGKYCATDVSSEDCFGHLKQHNLLDECNVNVDQCSEGAGAITQQQLERDDFDPRLEPFDYENFNLSVRLPQVAGVQPQWYHLSLGVTVYEEECVCESTSSYNFTLRYRQTYLNNTLTLAVTVVPSDKLLKWVFEYPKNCGDQQREIPYDSTTCGLPRFQKPTNLVLESNETHTTVSWNKTVTYINPVDNNKVGVNISTFYLRVHTCDKKSFDFEVTNTATVTLNISAVQDVSLHAYDKCSGLYERESLSRPVPYTGCSEATYCRDANSRDSCGDPACNPPPPVTVTSVLSTPLLSTTIVSTHQENSHHFLPVSIAASIAGAILVAVAIVVVVIFILRRKPKRKYGLLIRHGSPISSQQSALVVYSPSTPEEDKHVILQSFINVQNQVGIECIMQDKRKPRQSLVHWMTEHYKKAGTVFCVCNEEFQSDWENDRPPSEDSAVAVQTLRLLFEGDITSVQLRKYAVVLSKPADEVRIPPLLKALPRINLSDTSALVQFAGREASPV